jgi:hypothetical protein
MKNEIYQIKAFLLSYYPRKAKKGRSAAYKACRKKKNTAAKGHIRHRRLS